MHDLTDILFKAEQYNSAWTKKSLQLLIGKKKGVTFDWDMESGERWATFFVNGDFAGYVNSVIPLAFCKTSLLKETEKIFEAEVIIISEDNFDDKKWFIDPQRIKRYSSKLKWIIDEQVLTFERFSVNDFWYATI